MKLPITQKIELPNEVTASYAQSIMTVKGPKGEMSRRMYVPTVSITAEGNVVKLACPVATKREKCKMNTYRAHIRNMIKGVQEPYVYKLKVCSGHFPMNVSISGDQMVIKNFLGEKNPRMLKLKKGAEVKIDGDIITVQSVDKELAGKVASDIELLTAKSNRDLRVFQDGIYMIEKAGRAVGE